MDTIDGDGCTYGGVALAAFTQSSDLHSSGADLPHFSLSTSSRPSCGANLPVAMSPNEADLPPLSLALSSLSSSGADLASTPGCIFAFTSDLVKIRPEIDCMLENMPPSLMNKTLEVVPRVSQALRLIKLLC